MVGSCLRRRVRHVRDRKSTRLNSSHTVIYTLSYTTLFRSRTSLPRGLDVGLVAVAREDHDRDGGIMLAEAREACEPVELRHPHVEQDDVGIRLTHGGDDAAADRDLGHDLEILRGCERAPHRRQHEPVVVGHEYSKSAQTPQSFPWSRSR